MKKAFVVAIAAVCMLAACQNEEVTVTEEEVVKTSADDVPARYKVYQQQYEKALSNVVDLEQGSLQSNEELRQYYEARVAIWKTYMNELLGELRKTLPSEEWLQLKEQQERWYPQMEIVANKTAKAAAPEKSIIAYLEKKEDSMQIRARYLLDEYYYKRHYRQANE